MKKKHQHLLFCVWTKNAEISSLDNEKNCDITVNSSRRGQEGLQLNRYAPMFPLKLTCMLTILFLKGIPWVYFFRNPHYAEISKFCPKIQSLQFLTK